MDKTEKGGLKNPVKSMSNRQRFIYIEKGLNEAEEKIDKLENEIKENNACIRELRQEVKDYKEATKETKADWKSYIGWLLAIIALVVGVIPK